MNISLTPELEKLVTDKVKSGQYTSASEVVREGLRLVQEQDELRKIKLEMLRRDIQEGLNSGKSTPLDIEAIKAEGRKRLVQRKRKTHR